LVVSNTSLIGNSAETQQRNIEDIAEIGDNTAYRTDSFPASKVIRPTLDLIEKNSCTLFVEVRRTGLSTYVALPCSLF
jgi:hypothetical protein